MPDPTIKIQTTVINVTCSPVDKAMAQQIADDKNESMSKVIRDLLKSQHQMQFGNQPTCATGTQCLCAAMHQLRVRNHQTDEERVVHQHQNANPDQYLESR